MENTTFLANGILEDVDVAFSDSEAMKSSFRAARLRNLSVLESVDAFLLIQGYWEFNI